MALPKNGSRVVIQCLPCRVPCRLLLHQISLGHHPRTRPAYCKRANEVGQFFGVGSSYCTFLVFPFAISFCDFLLSYSSAWRVGVIICDYTAVVQWAASSECFLCIFSLYEAEIVLCLWSVAVCRWLGFVFVLCLLFLLIIIIGNTTRDLHRLSIVVFDL